MKLSVANRSGKAWSPIATQNSWGEWVVALLVVAGSCWFMMADHAWWRFKPYSLGTLNESLGLAGYYGIVLAFALGPARWQSIQLCGLVVLPLILAHFMVLGKIPGWFDWFTGADPKPAPPGTLVAFVLGSAIIALRVADFLGHAQFQISRTGKNVA